MEIKLMSYAITLELSDELYQPLRKAASEAGQTLEEWVLTTLRQQLAERDMRLRRHFGAVNLGTPTGADNTQIDADLAQAYSNLHSES